jgi:hypothetical protein
MHLKAEFSSCISRDLGVPSSITEEWNAIDIPSSELGDGVTNQWRVGFDNCNFYGKHILRKFINIFYLGKVKKMFS